MSNKPSNSSAAPSLVKLLGPAGFTPADAGKAKPTKSASPAIVPPGVPTGKKN
jgi:hypothetical protein